MSEFHPPEPSPAGWQRELEKIQAEVARERVPAEAHEPVPTAVPKPRKISRWLLALVALAVILAIALGPGILGSILDRWDYARSVHTDRSRVAHGVSPQTKRRALIVLRDENGQPLRALADEEALSEFVRREFRLLERARLDTHARVREALDARAAPVFAAMRSRVSDFADWYYAWPTSYRLTGKAMYSVAANFARPSVMRLDDAVAYDLERYVEKRYHDIVQRPEISDPMLQWSYVHAFERGYAGFQSALAGFDERFLRFVATRSDYLEGKARVEDVSMVLDWDHQTRKLSLTGVERDSLESARGIALASAGAMVGGRAGAAVGRRVAVRLAGPFVARGLSTAAAAAVGASVGPVGALLGGATGLGIDYASNEGIEYAERDALEARLLEALDVQRRQWQIAMQNSLAGAVDVWFDDLTEMLAGYR